MTPPRRSRPSRIPPSTPDATVAYGDHPDQVVDFYAPRGGVAAAPLVVLLHGGAWRSPYDRMHVTPFADFLARRGLAVANVEYRRGREIPQQRGTGPLAGRWPETFDDVAAVLDALPDLARKALPQADVRRTVLTGHSAGGHLALWASARHVLPVGSPWRLPAPPALRGVVALAPIADLTQAVELGVCGGAVRQLLGGDEEFDAAQCARRPRGTAADRHRHDRGAGAYRHHRSVLGGRRRTWTPRRRPGKPSG